MNIERSKTLNAEMVAEVPLTGNGEIRGSASSTTASTCSGRVRKPWPLIVLYLPAGLALLVVTVVSSATDMPISMFTRDPADVANISPFTGVISNIGILFWSAAATVCLFTYLLLKSAGSKAMLSWFFLVSGIITTMLMLDDLFLFHERIFPGFLHLRQRYTLVFYFVLVSVYLIGFRKVILSNEWFLLFLALSFFGLSVTVDISAKYLAEAVPFYHLFEDGFKLFGIVSWLGYFGRFSLQCIADGSPHLRTTVKCS